MIGGRAAVPAPPRRIQTHTETEAPNPGEIIMIRTTRRDILKQGALAAASGWPALAMAPAATAIPPIGRTRPSHLKLSIAAYSYRDYLASKPPRMTLFDYANLAA